MSAAPRLIGTTIASLATTRDTTLRLRWMPWLEISTDIDILVLISPAIYPDCCTRETLAALALLVLRSRPVVTKLCARPPRHNYKLAYTCQNVTTLCQNGTIARG